MTAEELENKVQRYFAESIAEGCFPDYAGMRLSLGLSEEEIGRLCESEDFAAVFRRARDRRESYLVRRMTADNKYVSGCMNALRQSQNGGYNEKSEQGAKTLILRMEGVGAAAFE